MLNITRFAVENLTQGCVTDVRRPRFSFALDSSREGAALRRAVLRVGDWEGEAAGQIAVPYGGAPLEPGRSLPLRPGGWTPPGRGNGSATRRTNSPKKRCHPSP